MSEKEYKSNVLTRYLWHLIAAIISAVCIVAVVSVCIPFWHKQWAAYREIKRELALANQAEQFPHRIRTMQADMAVLDSLLEVIEQKEPFTPANALDLVYTLADSFQCKTEKVQLEDPIPVAGGKEIPVTYYGQGSYHSIGRFVQGIENMHYATRIRQAVLKKQEDDRGELVLDFIIMER
ncbi:MAG: hypothetical protein ACOCW2_02050 [Chitinivibrionales bacterium]